MSIIDNVFKGLAKVQEKYAILIVLLLLTITAFFGYYAVRLETDSSFDVMFGEDSETIRLQNLLSNEYGSTDTLFVLVQIDEDSNEIGGVKDIRDPRVLSAMQQLSDSVEEETSVSEAASLADVMLLVYGRLPETLEESKQMIANLPSDIRDKFLRSLLNDEFSAMNMLISVDVANKPGSLIKIEGILRDKIDQSPFPVGVKATLTGLPVLINRILKFIIDDNIKTIGLAIFGVFLILWFYFRSWKISLFSVIPVIITLVWLSGTMYLLDIRISVMIASVGAMIIGMSVDYAIHLTHAYHEKVKEGHKHATEEAVGTVGPALFASVMTTLVGFIALTLGVTPNSQTQGTVLSLGIAFAFIVTILLLPALMVLQRRYVYSHLDEVVFRIRGKQDISKRRSVLDIFLRWIAGWQARRPGLVLFFILAITLLIIPGFGLVYLDTDDENWVPEQDEVVDALDELFFQFGGTDSMNLLIQLDALEGDFDAGLVRDLRDPRVLKPMATLDRMIENLDWVDVVESPTNEIRQVNNGVVPQDLESIKRIMKANPGIMDAYNDDFSLVKVTLRFDEINRPEFFELMREVEGVSFPNEVEIIPQGGIPEDIELEQTLQADTMRTTGMGFIFVIIVASLFYLSIVAGLLAFIPIIIAIVWTVGLMGYINLPFTVLTTGMLAILMGLGIDFSIHLIHAIKYNMKKFKDLEKAIPEALLSTGEAISITTMTTVFGFMVLTFATLVNTKRLGWTLALGILATFFACMLIVPAVMAIKYKFKRRGVRDE